MRLKKPHYAWTVCIGCALLLFCTSGLAVNAFTIYQPFIMEQNGFSNTQTSSIVSFRTFAGLVGMLLSGVFYKKVSLRNGMGLAGIASAAGFALFGLAKTYPVYCLAAVVAGIGYGLGAMIPIAIVIRSWFYESRNLAIGICSAATGLSTLGIPSLITKLISRIGLGRTFLAEAAVMTAAVAVSYLMIRSSPDDKGVRPFGTKTDEPLRKTSPSGLTAGQSALLFPAIFLVGGVMSVAYCHFSVLITGEGYDASDAALASAFSGAALIIGKILYGRLGDRITNYKSNYIFGPLLFSGCLLCCFIPYGKAVVYISELVFSAGMAFTSVGLTAWASDLSSEEKCNGNIRLFQILYAAGTLTFSPLPGMIADRTGGSYIPAYAMFAALALYIITAVQYCYRQAENQKKRLTDRRIHT